MHLCGWQGDQQVCLSVSTPGNDEPYARVLPAACDECATSKASSAPPAPPCIALLVRDTSPFKHSPGPLLGIHHTCPGLPVGWTS